MALPNKEELQILPAFRQKLADALTEKQLNDDTFLLRWLRGITCIFDTYILIKSRDLDEVAAETLLRKVLLQKSITMALIWREENNLDTLEIGQASPSFIYQNFPRYMDGVDKEGRPIVSCPFGKWDVRRVIREGMVQGFIFYLAETFEEMNRLIEKNQDLYPPEPGQPPITQFIGILDWKNFAWGQIFNYKAVQALLQAGSIYEAYFPEILHTFYFVNCPSLISTFLALLKPIISPKTMSKIKVFGTDESKWQAELLKHIDASQLRRRFGGTKEDSDDKC